MDKDPTEELTTYYENFFVKKENETEVGAAVDFWQNSWTAGKRSQISTEVLQKAINNLKKQILEAKHSQRL